MKQVYVRTLTDLIYQQAVHLLRVGSLSKTVEDEDSNVSKTIRLIHKTKSAREYVK